MLKLKVSSDKILQKISCGVFGILSITFGFFGDLTAYLLYPGYDFRRRAVSSLCLGPGGLFFQSGTVISGIFALLFLISLEGTFNEEKISVNLRRNAKYTAIISCISFILLGFFCGSNPIIAYVHGINAVISWIFGLAYITLFNNLFLKSSRYSKFLGYFGFFASFTLSLLMFIFFLHLFPTLRFLVIILPSLEWVNTLMLILWYLVVSSYIIKKKI
ncbi:MAG: hypothetical protein ACFE91_02365 [Promethearchaeota archaeon]